MISVDALSALPGARLTVAKVIPGSTFWTAAMTWRGGPDVGVIANSESPAQAIARVLRLAEKHANYDDLDELLS